MPYSFRSGRFTQNPGRRIDVDLSHPLAKNIVAAIIPTGGTQAVELLTGQITTPTAASAIPSPCFGNWGPSMTLNNDAVSGHLTFPTYSLQLDRLTGTGTIMVEAGLSPTGNGNGTMQRLFRSSESGLGTGVGFCFDDGGFANNSAGLFVNNNVYGFTNSPGNYLGSNSELLIHRCGISFDGTTAYLFAKGSQAQTASVADTVTANTNRRTRLFGQYDTANGSGYYTRFSLILVWSGCWQAGQYAELYRNFWQIFRPSVNRAYFYTASASGAHAYGARLGGGFVNMAGNLRQ